MLQTNACDGDTVLHTVVITPPPPLVIAGSHQRLFTQEVTDILAE